MQLGAEALGFSGVGERAGLDAEDDAAVRKLGAADMCVEGAEDIALLVAQLLERALGPGFTAERRQLDTWRSLPGGGGRAR